MFAEPSIIVSISKCSDGSPTLTEATTVTTLVAPSSGGRQFAEASSMRMLSLILACAAILPCGCTMHSPLALRSLDDRLVYQPTRYPVGKWDPKGLVHEDVWF